MVTMASRRMGEPRGTSRAGMEFANRMFLQDDEDAGEAEQDAFTMGEIQPSTNFSNPVYETMFQVSRIPTSPCGQDSARTPILRGHAGLAVLPPPSPTA